MVSGPNTGCRWPWTDRQKSLLASRRLPLLMTIITIYTVWRYLLPRYNLESKCFKLFVLWRKKKQYSNKVCFWITSIAVHHIHSIIVICNQEVLERLDHTEMAVIRKTTNQIVCSFLTVMFILFYCPALEMVLDSNTYILLIFSVSTALLILVLLFYKKITYFCLLFFALSVIVGFKMIIYSFSCIAVYLIFFLLIDDGIYSDTQKRRFVRVVALYVIGAVLCGFVGKLPMNFTETTKYSLLIFILPLLSFFFLFSIEFAFNLIVDKALTYLPFWLFVSFRFIRVGRRLARLAAIHFIWINPLISLSPWNWIMIIFCLNKLEPKYRFFTLVSFHCTKKRKLQVTR